MALTPAAPPAGRDPLGTACAVAIPVLAVAAPLVSFMLVWTAFGLLFTLAGGTPVTAAEQQLASRLALAAGAVAIGGPVLGFVLAVRAESRVGMWTFVVMCTVGLAFAVVVGIGFGLTGRSVGDPSPQPTSTRSVCQEHSGGDTRCPGG